MNEIKPGDLVIIPSAPNPTILKVKSKGKHKKKGMVLFLGFGHREEKDCIKIPDILKVFYD
jgi:hypothetical protein